MPSSSSAFAAGGIDVVLGGTGTIGALLVQRLAAAGRKVKSVSRSGTVASNVLNVENVEGVRASVLDVAESKPAPPLPWLSPPTRDPHPGFAHTRLARDAQ